MPCEALPPGRKELQVKLDGIVGKVLYVHAAMKSKMLF